MKIDQGRKYPTRWGGEEGDTVSPRQQVRHVRGRIVPCDSCKRVYNCAMYQSFTRHRMGGGEYSQGTNILHNCDIYVGDKTPGDIRNVRVYGRTRGKEPT